jgi:hypothetical protein
MKEDMLVRARYKDAPENEWFDVLLTDDQRMYEKATGKEITRTDLLFKANDDADEIIDMDAEWEEYKHEKLLDTLHMQASYLARQALRYAKGEEPKVHVEIAETLYRQMTSKDPANE